MAREWLNKLTELNATRSKGKWITTEEKPEGNCYYSRYKRNIYASSKYPVCFVRGDAKRKGQADADLNIIAMVPRMASALLEINELAERWKNGHTEEEWCAELIFRILEKETQD